MGSWYSAPEVADVQDVMEMSDGDDCEGINEIEVEVVAAAAGGGKSKMVATGKSGRGSPPSSSQAVSHYPYASEVLSLEPSKRYKTNNLPINVFDEAAVVVQHMGDAQLAIEMRGAVTALVVLQPQQTKRRRQAAEAPLAWPFVASAEDVANLIRRRMVEDGLNAIQSAAELFARYPGLFWNVVYHTTQNADKLQDFIRDELCR